jgi:predicted SAM-dependent methyltransferase
MKIIVGSNGYTAHGWVSTDYPEVDITKPLPYADNSLEALFCSHTAEHVSGPDFMRFLIEVYRVLVPGGYFRISIPVIGWWLKREHIFDLMTNHGHCAGYNEELVRTLLWTAGFSPDAIRKVDFDESIEHHWKTIGRELDQIESLRLIATK